MEEGKEIQGSMIELSTKPHDQLDETRGWTFQMIMGVARASIMALVVWRCKTMGSVEDFRRLWSFPGDNPFATQRGTIPRRPSEKDVQVPTNVLPKTDPEMPPQADRFPNWPKRFTKKYVDWCESRLEDGLCCAHKLLEAPMPIT